MVKVGIIFGELYPHYSCDTDVSDDVAIELTDIEHKTVTEVCKKYDTIQNFLARKYTEHQAK